MKFIGELSVYTAGVPVVGYPGVCNHEVLRADCAHLKSEREVLGNVVVSCVAVVVLASCGMHSTWHRFCVLGHPFPSPLAQS